MRLWHLGLAIVLRYSPMQVESSQVVLLWAVAKTWNIHHGGKSINSILNPSQRPPSTSYRYHMKKSDVKLDLQVISCMQRSIGTLVVRLVGAACCGSHRITMWIGNNLEPWAVAVTPQES
jgi:hypothetical protein